MTANRQMLLLTRILIVTLGFVYLAQTATSFVSTEVRSDAAWQNKVDTLKASLRTINETLNLDLQSAEDTPIPPEYRTYQRF